MKKLEFSPKHFIEPNFIGFDSFKMFTSFDNSKHFVSGPRKLWYNDVPIDCYSYRMRSGNTLIAYNVPFGKCGFSLDCLKYLVIDLDLVRFTDVDYTLDFSMAGVTYYHFLHELSDIYKAFSYDVKLYDNDYNLGLQHRSRKTQTLSYPFWKIYNKAGLENEMSLRRRFEFNLQGAKGVRKFFGIQKLTWTDLISPENIFPMFKYRFESIFKLKSVFIYDDSKRLNVNSLIDFFLLRDLQEIQPLNDVNISVYVDKLSHNFSFNSDQALRNWKYRLRKKIDKLLKTD